MSLIVVDGKDQFREDGIVIRRNASKYGKEKLLERHTTGWGFHDDLATLSTSNEQHDGAQGSCRSFARHSERNGRAGVDLFELSQAGHYELDPQVE
jgi:hypothetical protein